VARGAWRAVRDARFLLRGARSGARVMRFWHNVPVARGYSPGHFDRKIQLAGARVGGAIIAVLVAAATSITMKG